MSRTDVHTPGWVKVLSPDWWEHLQVVHNHERGDCDLARFYSSRGEARTRCYVMLWPRGRNVGCGCRMCTQQVERLLETRRERRRVKKILRQGRFDLA